MDNENRNFESQDAEQIIPETIVEVVPEIEETEQPSTIHEDTVQQPIYSYTAEASTQYVPNGQSPEPHPQGGDTVTFHNIAPQSEHRSNTGLKVFFSMIAVVIALIIALSAGYILGSKKESGYGYGYGYGNNVTTSLANKEDAQYNSDLSVVFNNVNPSVVAISVFSGSKLIGYASGVVYTSDGYIVTNDHIYADVPSAEFVVTLYDGTNYTAKFVAGDTRSDLAVLKVEATGLKAATFGNHDQVVTGEQVISIGYPQGATSKAILTAGTVSSTNIRFTSTTSYSMKMIQTDAAINPGNSGGALVNMYSQVIGIPSVKLTSTSYDNVGYAIPSSTVVKVADSLIKNGYVEGRGKLGISYSAIDSVQAKISNVPSGLQIVEITIESELNGKGIKVNDIITHINDIRITDSSVALDIIEGTAPGVTMSFTYYNIEKDKSETVYASLLPDQGNSSYTEAVTDEKLPNNSNPFSDHNLEDFFSDH